MQNFEVLDVCVLGINVEFDFGHWYVEIDTVEYLAESSTVDGRVSGCASGKGHPREVGCGECGKPTQFHIARPL